MKPSRRSAADASPLNLLLGLQGLLVDLDGVTYRGETPLPGARELVPALQSLGIRHVFVTNNATLTPEQVARKLQGMGIPAQPEDIVTSAEAAASYLRAIAPPGTPVYVIGEEGLQEPIRRAGFTFQAERPSFVVVGLDRQLTYERLAIACVAIRAGARFIATNADPAYPVDESWWPSAGAIVAALATATGQQPTVIGKPEPTLLRVALERIGVGPEAAAMVGDQIGTDVRAGRAAGMTTVLVSEQDPPEEADPRPDLCVRDLADLLARLQRARGAM